MNKRFKGSLREQSLYSKRHSPIREAALKTASMRDLLLHVEITRDASIPAFV
jgi:hypothetical protein